MGKKTKKTYHVEMKINLFTFSLFFLLLGCGNTEQFPDPNPQEKDAPKSEELSKLQIRGNLVYLQNTEAPFTGQAQAQYEDGQVRSIARFENGELKELTRWWPNGARELELELEFKKGKVNSKDIELYESSSSFVLVPPPVILNLQSVERESHLEHLITKHTEGLTSQRLRANVILRLQNSPEYTSILLAPYLKDEMDKELSKTFSYTIAQSGTKSRPRFIITSQARTAKGAMIVANLAQQEYEKLHRTTQSEKIMFVERTLEDLLETSLTNERNIAADMANFKKVQGLPFIEDEKRDLAARKSAYAQEITENQIEQIKAISLLRQIESINERSKKMKDSYPKSAFSNDFYSIKEYWEIDAIEHFGDLPELRKTLSDLEQARRDFEGNFLITRDKNSTMPPEKDPWMLKNERDWTTVRRQMVEETTSAIKDIKDRLKHLILTEKEFAREMSKVQQDSEKLSAIEETLKNYERQLAVVQRSTDAIFERLNEVNIEQALPGELDEPLRIENFANLLHSPLPPPPQPRVEEVLLSKDLASEKMPWHRHGSFVAFYKNGQKQVEGSYSKGKETGLWISYDQDGKETNRKSFKGGDSNANAQKE